MATRLTITTPGTAWAKLDAELKGFPKELRQVHYAAVKRTADEGRVMIFARFKEQYPNVQKSKIETGDLTKRKRPIVSKVINKEEQPTGIITVYDYKIPLIAFKPTGGGARIPSGPGGVRITMDKSKGTTVFKHAFKAKMKSGHIGIFSRLRARGARADQARRHKFSPSGFAARLPVRELFGPSIYDLVDVPKINAEVSAKLDDILIKNIESQIKRVPLLKK